MAFMTYNPQMVCARVATNYLWFYACSANIIQVPADNGPLLSAIVSPTQRRQVDKFVKKIIFKWSDRNIYTRMIAGTNWFLCVVMGAAAAENRKGKICRRIFIMFLINYACICKNSCDRCFCDSADPSFSQYFPKCLQFLTGYNNWLRIEF